MHKSTHTHKHHITLHYITACTSAFVLIEIIIIITHTPEHRRRTHASSIESCPPVCVPVTTAHTHTRYFHSFRVSHLNYKPRLSYNHHLRRSARDSRAQSAHGHNTQTRMRAHISPFRVRIHVMQPRTRGCTRRASAGARILLINNKIIPHIKKRRRARHEQRAQHFYCVHARMTTTATCV